MWYQFLCNQCQLVLLNHNMKALFIQLIWSVPQYTLSSLLSLYYQINLCLFCYQSLQEPQLCLRLLVCNVSTLHGDAIFSLQLLPCSTLEVVFKLLEQAPQSFLLFTSCPLLSQQLRPKNKLLKSIFITQHLKTEHNKPCLIHTIKNHCTATTLDNNMLHMLNVQGFQGQNIHPICHGDSGLLVVDTVSLGKQFLTFQTTVMPLSASIQQSYPSQTDGPYMPKAPWSLKMHRTPDPMTICLGNTWILGTVTVRTFNVTTYTTL